jgi:hypothetical protein
MRVKPFKERMPAAGTRRGGSILNGDIIEPDEVF